MKRVIITCCGCLLFAGACLGAEKPLLQDENDRINYSVGFQVGGDLRQQKVRLNEEALLRGLQDALAGNDPLMTAEQMRSTLVELKKKMLAAEAEEKKARAERYRQEDRAFLEENARKEGVVTLPSGLQYQILKEGSGRPPTIKDTVTVEYRGSRVDGREFDNSAHDGKPATFPLAEAIPGWKEALPMMKTGAKWRIVLPTDLAFGKRGPLADRAVIYEIELLSFQPAE